METTVRTTSGGAPAVSVDSTRSSRSQCDGPYDWAALDALAFDSTLSFLDDHDGEELKPVAGTAPSSLVASARSPPLLPESDAADLATAELVSQLLDADRDSSELNEPVEAPPVRAKPGAPGVDFPPPPAVSQPSKSKSTASRARQKQEIEYLRVQVAELESELSNMKQRDGSEEVVVGSSCVWENIAKRQFDEKQRAEIENMKLRELLEGQLRVARSLEKLLRKRSLASGDTLFVERKRARGSSALDLEEAAAEIRQRIARQFEDVDQVLQDCGLSAVAVDMDEARATNDAANAICMELTIVKVFPFALAGVADAVWQLTSAERIELPDGYYGATRRSETLAELEFAVGLRVRRSEATIHVRGVGARRTTGERTLIVFETVGVTEGPLFAGHGITCRERMYVLIEEGPPSPSSSAPSTVVKVCVRMWPETEADDSSSSSDTVRAPYAGLFVDLVLGSYNQNVKTILQSIENALLARGSN